jgi:hypothetical protein
MLQRTALQFIKSYNPCTLAGFEPTIVCSVGGDDDHYTTPPGYDDYNILINEMKIPCIYVM